MSSNLMLKLTCACRAADLYSVSSQGEAYCWWVAVVCGGTRYFCYSQEMKGFSVGEEEG